MKMNLQKRLLAVQWILCAISLVIFSILIRAVWKEGAGKKEKAKTEARA